MNRYTLPHERRTLERRRKLDKAALILIEYTLLVGLGVYACLGFGGLL